MTIISFDHIYLFSGENTVVSGLQNEEIIKLLEDGRNSSAFKELLVSKHFNLLHYPNAKGFDYKSSCGKLFEHKIIPFGTRIAKVSQSKNIGVGRIENNIDRNEYLEKLYAFIFTCNIFHPLFDIIFCIPLNYFIKNQNIRNIDINFINNYYGIDLQSIFNEYKNIEKEKLFTIG